MGKKIFKRIRIVFILVVILGVGIFAYNASKTPSVETPSMGGPAASVEGSLFVEKNGTISNKTEPIVETYSLEEYLTSINTGSAEEGEVPQMQDMAIITDILG